MKQSVIFEKPVYISSVYSIVGSEEKKGKFGNYFDEQISSPEFGEDSFEKAERKMQKKALLGAIEKTNMKIDDIQAILAGDLLNQIITSGYTARDFDTVFLGLYSACSTIAEAMIVGSLLVSHGHFQNVACVTSSHFCSAERQYRFPLELGTPRTPLSQWTVTAAGSMILSAFSNEKCPKITCATLGKIVDYEIKDANNMGAAMAPAAVDTLVAHFKDFGRTPEYYDAIITGDLGKYGSEIFAHLAKQEGFFVSNRYFDCGAEIFGDDAKKFQGGSGAGCGTTVFNSYVYQKLMAEQWHKVLFIPTGALMSKVSSLQGESIPAIAQAVCVEI